MTLFNGDGFNYHSTLVVSSPGNAIANIHKKVLNPAESPLNISLVQSLAKGSKLDLVIQKATELGVRRTVPVISERSVMRIDEKRIDRKLDHWRGIAVSAATQCQRSVIPEIDPPLKLRDWFAGNAAQTTCLLLHPHADHRLKEIALEALECTVIVGPEGGFTDDEVNYAIECGVSTFQCGPRILRTETAGFTAIGILQSLYGDL